MSSLLAQHKCLGIALEKRDSYTEGHCGRVEMLCLELGRRCRLGAAELNLLRVAARLHDVGKIGIPDHVLLKPSSFDSDEWETMKSHAALGQQICNAIAHKDAKKVGIVVRHHHEAFDGSGYPDGLAGDRIPIGSRIITIVDSYDAMITGRPYHRPRSAAAIMEIMQNEAGHKHDPFVLDRFHDMVRQQPAA